MNTCIVCYLDFPGELILHNKCPICTRDAINRVHGLPLNTPFQGEQAQRLYNKAVSFNNARP